MNKTKLEVVARLAREVEALCLTVLDDIDSGQTGYSADMPKPSRHTGELRRRSLDLTRALADLRKTSSPWRA